MTTFIEEPLEPDELPEERVNDTKLILIPQYFARNESGYKLPKILKRARTEKDVSYETRVKNYLLNMDDTNFMRLADLIDPDDAIQYAFFELYNEVSNDRANKPEKDSKCTIFWKFDYLFSHSYNLNVFFVI